MQVRMAWWWLLAAGPLATACAPPPADEGLLSAQKMTCAAPSEAELWANALLPHDAILLSADAAMKPDGCAGYRLEAVPAGRIDFELSFLEYGFHLPVLSTAETTFAALREVLAETPIDTVLLRAPTREDPSLVFALLRRVTFLPPAALPAEAPPGLLVTPAGSDTLTLSGQATAAGPTCITIDGARFCAESVFGERPWNVARALEAQLPSFLGVTTPATPSPATIGDPVTLRFVRLDGECGTSTSAANAPPAEALAELACR